MRGVFNHKAVLTFGRCTYGNFCRCSSIGSTGKVVVIFIRCITQGFHRSLKRKVILALLEAISSGRVPAALPRYLSPRFTEGSRIVLAFFFVLPCHRNTERLSRRRLPPSFIAPRPFRIRRRTHRLNKHI